MILYDPKNKDEWLEYRINGIGGSDAACIIGKNKYKTNVQLWEEKTGLSKPYDISNSPSVIFGKSAEEHIRQLYILKHNEYSLEYHEFRMYCNENLKTSYATLDGELKEKETGEKGVLEIKTTEINNSIQWDEWNNRIPDQYYCQILHQLYCTGYSFSVVVAYIMHSNGVTIRDYKIDRSDVENDIKYLIDKEKEFWEYVKNKKRPSLILPEV